MGGGGQGVAQEYRIDIVSRSFHSSVGGFPFAFADGCKLALSCVGGSTNAELMFLPFPASLFLIFSPLQPWYL